MKKSFLLFALLLGLMPSLFAQDAMTKLTADEIVNNYVEVIGGADAWKAVKNMKSDMKMSIQGMEIPIAMYSSAPNKFRMDINVMGQKIVQSFDGGTAWQIMPMMGINKPTEMGEAEAKEINQNELVPEFIDYAERGYTIELVDSREIEGVPTQGLRITDGKDKDMTYYFDLENFVPIMMEIVVKEGQYKGATIEHLFSDYQEVGESGLIIPYYMEVKAPDGTRKMTVTNVELNTEIEENFFSMPE